MGDRVKWFLKSGSLRLFPWKVHTHTHVDTHMHTIDAYIYIYIYIYIICHTHIHPLHLKLSYGYKKLQNTFALNVRVLAVSQDRKDYLVIFAKQ